MSRESPARPARGSVLGPGDIERIHELALKTIEKTGIILHYPPARELLRQHGARVDEARALARIPRGLVEQALVTAPASFTMCGHADPRRDCLLGVGGGVYARPASGLNWILDAGAKARRAVTEADAIAWTRVAQAMPNIHLAAAAYDQVGRPTAMEVRAVERMLRHSGKPLMVSGVSGEGMHWIHRLTEVTQAPGRQPRVMVLSSVNSPLLYSYGQLEAALISAELGIPVLVNSSAVSGVTAPVTLAGDLVQMHAEMLAALTILQLHRPGAPVVYAGHPVIMDMRTGLATFGFAEIGLLAAACIEIGGHCHLPTASDGLTCDSCTPDALAASEKWASGYLAAMSGANVNGGAGALASQSTISLEQLAIDDEIYGQILRHRQGIKVDEETLAGALIARVGPGGSYLAEEHTRLHYRQECWYSRLAVRQSAPAWEASGARDVLERASDMVHGILATPEEPLLTEAQARVLDELVASAEAALAQIELPI
jgi:trimethylamine--corrinoid protein Co-methyltransferase